MSEEEELVARAQLGDRSATESLFRKYQDDLYRFAHSLMQSDWARAQDLAQDAFLAAFENLGSLRSTSSFRSWLLGITYNLHRNHVRRKSVERGHFSTVAAIREQPRGVDEIVLSHEEHDTLRLALSIIPAGQKNALYLREILGCSYMETATILGISENAAKNRVHAGRENVRTAIGKLNQSSTGRNTQDGG